MTPSATGQKLDYGKVNVKFKGTATPDETVPYVERADRCDPTRGGWYYDVHPTAGTPNPGAGLRGELPQVQG
jgi:hypothetical protein